MDIICRLCGEKSRFIYKLNSFDIYQCKNCLSAFVNDFPSDAELETFYNGFKFCINENNKEKIQGTEFKKWMESFSLPANAKMLDVGGGGGFFSLAFEKFGLGEATYIDIDSQSCDYAKNQNITRVINDDVCKLNEHTNEKFDFIYSRHLIEHLKNPTTIIDSLVQVLAAKGVLIIQCPNGLSLERLPDKKHFQNRCSMLIKSNYMDKSEATRFLYSNKTGFGLDPVRHLWAFSSKGMDLYLQTIEGITHKIKTYSIEDKIYSPWVKKTGNINSLLRKLYSIPQGKAHLVVEVRKK